MLTKDYSWPAWWLNIPLGITTPILPILAIAFPTFGRTDTIITQEERTGYLFFYIQLLDMVLLFFFDIHGRLMPHFSQSQELQKSNDPPS